VKTRRIIERRIQDSIAEASETVKAETLAVLTKPNGSITCSVKVGSEHINLTLRFDKGEEASLRGWPRDWAIHDDDAEDEVEDAVVHVSKEMEIEILQQLKKSLMKQFRDPMFKISYD
jgi:hypothetical protein